MHYLKELRLQIGISQATMANLLGTKESQVAMAEIGKRSLSTKSSNLLYLLKDVVARAETHEIPEMPVITDEKSDRIRAKKKRTDKVHLGSLQYSVTLLEERIEKAKRIYRLAVLLETERPLPDDGLICQYIGIMKLEAHLTYFKSDDAWKTAQVKIAGLEAELKKMEELGVG